MNRQKCLDNINALKLKNIEIALYMLPTKESKELLASLPKEDREKVVYLSGGCYEGWHNG